MVHKHGHGHVHLIGSTQYGPDNHVLNRCHEGPRVHPPPLEVPQPPRQRPLAARLGGVGGLRAARNKVTQVSLEIFPSFFTKLLSFTFFPDFLKFSKFHVFPSFLPSYQTRRSLTPQSCEERKFEKFHLRSLK